MADAKALVPIPNPGLNLQRVAWSEMSVPIAVIAIKWKTLT